MNEGPPGAPGATGALRFVCSARTDIGCVRKVNEDACLARPDIGLWVVADGMGGHYAGDYASQQVMAALESVERPGDAAGFLNVVKARLVEAHNHLRAEAARRGGGGVIIATTVVALLIHGRHYACVWAGDSRLYLRRDARIAQVTRDHSYVQSLLDGGMITPQQARVHPHANVVTRAVGAEDNLDIEVRLGEARAGDQFLLCSDGLSRKLEDAEIGDVMGACDGESAADELVAVALARAANDNVTVVSVLCR